MMSPTVLISIDDAELSSSLLMELGKFDDITVCLPQDSNAGDAQMAVCWHPDPALLDKFPQIQCLHSAAAGVDHLGQSLLASGLPVARIVDPDQKQGMLEYVLWCVLNHHRDFDRAVKNQAQQRWNLYPQHPSNEVRVGVMGLGEIGAHVATGLAQFGYSVLGWSRRPKQLERVSTFSGPSEFTGFLEQVDVLVNLLPLNQATQGILNQSLFQALPKGACLVNTGRGGHLVEADLISALETGWLRSAVLDVFTVEPLPADHPLWTTEGVIVTPHMASSSSAAMIAHQVHQNVLRFIKGQPLLNTIDRTLGY
ncbi:2-hydroxyacid dehydrogenase [Neptunomonas phycophila]|uniref:2-hydroxyacid dehydrogenase n=2 Tax=Oceanospirillaceae TaxID=135620 RepID=UPI0035176E9A